MTMTAAEILEHVRALPERERLRLVERVVNEVVDRTAPAPSSPSTTDAIWADVSDEEFDAFLHSIRASRSEPWRSTG